MASSNNLETIQFVKLTFFGVLLLLQSIATGDFGQEITLCSVTYSSANPFQAIIAKCQPLLRCISGIDHNRESPSVVVCRWPSQNSRNIINRKGVVVGAPKCVERDKRLLPLSFVAH